MLFYFRDDSYNFIFYILSLFLILILSFNLVSSDSPNTLEYENNNLTAVIKNSSGAKIGEATLKSHLTPSEILFVPEGRNKTVMYYDFNFTNGINLLGDVEFIDLNTGQPIDKHYYFAKAIFEDKNISDYRMVCDGTNITDYNPNGCHNTEVGTHIEKKVIKWEKLNSRVISSGNITIGLITHVNRGDKIDGAWNIAGLRISRHAVWKSSWDTGLVAYYNFSSQLEQLDPTNNNLTIGSGSISLVSNLTSALPITDNKTAFFSSGGYNVTNLNYFGLNQSANSSFTIGCWIKRPSSAGNNVVMGKGTGGVTGWDFGFHSSNYIFARGVSTSNFLQSPTGGLAFNRYYFAVLKRNSTSTCLYINGTTTTTCEASQSTITNTFNFQIGFNAGSGEQFEGYVEECFFANRTWSDTEINDVYDNGVGSSRDVSLPLDTTAPNTTTPIITPIQPKTNQSLNCNATLTDNIQTNLTAFWKWYKNNELNLSGSSSGIQNGTINTSITILDSGNTTKGEVWICEVKPFDGINNGTAKNSSGVTILNSAPIHNNPKLTTLTGKNLSTENLTCNNQTTSDADNDPVTNIYNWYKNSQSISVLNLPFEINANDYSSNNNDGIIEGAIFTNGTVGRALEFDGVDDFVNLSRPSSLVNLDTTLSVEAWVFSDNNTAQHLIFDECEFFATEGYCLLILDNEFRFHVGLAGAPKATAGGIQTGKWYHVVGTYDNSSIKIYVNGTLINTTSAIGPLNKNGDEDIILGHNSPSQTNDFDGKIDEFRVYNIALTSEQVKQRFEETKNGLTSSSKIVSQETSGGNVWMCQITPNDGGVDGVTLNSTNLSVLWGITFNVTDSFSNASLNNVIINCTAPNFNQGGDITNPYGPFGFSPGIFTCTFEESIHFDKTIIFNADNDKVISVKMSEKAGLTIEEHTWLEAIYNCINGGNCALYNLLLEVNKTVGNIWEHTKPTDETIITFENVTNKVLNASNNLTIDYSVKIPIKAGYSLGTYLPVRIGFWFLDTTNITCFNQGNRPTGVSDPYCQPLITEVIGPMGGSVNFTVKLRPSLPAGNYSIKRIIDIDPNNVWINYGQETIGIITLTESLNDFGISLEKTGEIIPIINSGGSSGIVGSGGGSGGGGGTTIIIKEKEVIKLAPQEDGDKKEKSEEDKTKIIGGTGITGGVIGASLLSGKQIVIIIAILAGVFVVFIIITSRTILKLKKK